MKVKHVLIIAAVLLALFVAPVAADTTEESQPHTGYMTIGAVDGAVYSIAIPEKVDFTSVTAGAIVSADIGVEITKIDPNSVINISVVNEDGWYLMHEKEGTGYRLAYNMTVDGVEVASGVVLSTDKTAEKEVTFTLKEGAKKSGKYTDTLTFTAEMKESDNEEVAVYVDGGDELAAAATNAEAEATTYIMLEADITGNVEVPQTAKDSEITIDGNGHTFTGAITVNGGSNAEDNAVMTIKNIKFEATDKSSIGGSDAFIRMGVSGDNNARYISTLVVEDCTFSGNDIVAIKSYTGGDKKLIIKNCTVNAGMHSLAQLKNVKDGVQIIDCKVYSVRGISLGHSELEMINSNFDVQKYAVRFGGNEGEVDDQKGPSSITGGSLKSTYEGADDDAVIVFRYSGVDSTLTLSGVTLNAPEGKSIYYGAIEGKTTITKDNTVNEYYFSTE